MADEFSATMPTARPGRGIFDTGDFQIARERHITPAAAADAFAEERIGKIGRVRLYWVPGGRGWARIWGRG